MDFYHLYSEHLSSSTDNLSLLLIINIIVLDYFPAKDNDKIDFYIIIIKKQI